MLKLRDMPYQDDTVIAEMPLFEDETVEADFNNLSFESPMETKGADIIVIDEESEH